MRQGGGVDTLEYAPGRLVDVHRGAGAGHVLLWHGRQPDMRDAVAPLSELIAAARAHRSCGRLELPRR